MRTNTKEKAKVRETDNTEETPTYLQVAAYYRWQERDCPVNDDWTDWLAAEQKRNNKK